MEISGAWNAEYIDEQYKRWKTDSDSVSQDWRFFFEGFELAYAKDPGAPEPFDEEQSLRQSRVEALIYRYRDLGHLLACLDPLVACPTTHPLLDLAAFNLSTEDLERVFIAPDFSKSNQAQLKDILRALQETYCRSVGVEYMHLQDPDEQAWIRQRIEPDRNQPQFSSKTKLQILEKLNQASLFESFLHKKYVGQTRFSLEGAEAFIPMLAHLFQQVAANGCREIILGMAHRGRLNVQTHVLGKSYEEIFTEFEHCHDPEGLVGAGDVKYHNGYFAEIATTTGTPLQAYLVNNPSHLEAVNPVVEGMARARQDSIAQDAYRSVMPVLIHGDSAFAGQGIVAETLNMSQLDGYRTGGTVHVIINNQIGYTTLPEDARSTRYATDVAKMIMVPIFHVHGENPEAVVHVAQIAADYRMEFGKDVVIDLICYRRYGHNEGDEPYFTQPLMYERIRERPPVHQLYAQRLIEANVVATDTVEKIQEKISGQLETAYQNALGECPMPVANFFSEWQGFSGTYTHEDIPTGVAGDTLKDLARKLNTVPSGFSIHLKLQKLLKKRLQAVAEDNGIDWANSELLAFASLLIQGFPIRLSGQDSRRGTFSQRHCELVSNSTGKRYSPLNTLTEKQAPFKVYDSMLSEAGILGFEYGYALTNPQALVIWEAQFGDFANNAQSIIDLFIAAGESKWQRLNGLVMLLPHGYDGLGPEHSSARLERYLQLCAVDNLQICYPTTPAQHFHMLRRQVLRNVRKPLIVMSPKSLLRHPLAVSALNDLTTGAFSEVIDDPENVAKPTRVIFCSGKIYYHLLQRRQTLHHIDNVILRLEQLYPFPESQLVEAIKPYRTAKQWLWVQEEPENMGAWRFVKPYLESIVDQKISYVGRPSAASPATGFPQIYQREQNAIADQAIGPLPEKKSKPAAS